MFTRFVPKEKAAKTKITQAKVADTDLEQFEIARPCRKKRFSWSYVLVAIGTSPSQWKMRVDIGKLSRNTALNVGCHMSNNIDGPSWRVCTRTYMWISSKSCLVNMCLLPCSGSPHGTNLHETHASSFPWVRMCFLVLWSYLQDNRTHANLV